MKNLKKITALVIVLALALSSMAFASFTDVSEDASYNEAITVMSAFKLLLGYEDGTFGPDKTITRAEFAAVVVRALGMEDAAKGAVTNTQFTDVKSDHWAAGYIQIATQQGIIAGYGNGLFGPEDEVTYEQAVKMIVCALGYAPKFKNVADAYPTAYLAQANTSGITVGAAGKIGEKASRAVVARLVYNSLDVPMMEQLSFGTDVEYGIPEDPTTLLANNLKIAKVEASVSSVSFDKENGNELTLNITDIDEVYEEISGLTKSSYTMDYAETVDPIKGYTCVAYIDCNEDDNVLVALAPKSGKNKTLTLTSKQTKDGVADFDNLELTYYKTSSEVDSDDTKVKFDSNVEVYVNLNSNEETDLDLFASNYNDGDYPEITLIDNNNDNKYDYIYATQYYSMVAGDITARNFRIAADGKSSGAPSSIFLDPEDEDISFDILDKDGKAVKFEDIKKGDVLNVFESKDSDNNTYNKVIVTSSKLEGTVSEENSDDEYKIGDKYYTSEASINVGDSGVFYVDMYDVVLKYDLSGSNRTFGMVYATYIDDSGLDEDAKTVIYTTEGKFETYGYNKNVKIDSKSVTNDDITAANAANNPATNDPTDTDDESYTIIITPAVLDNPATADINEAKPAVTAVVNPGNIVMYVTNSEGLITEIYTPGYIANKTDNSYQVVARSSEDYRASSKKLGGEYVVDNSKLIANELAKGTDFEKEDISMASASLFNEDTEYNYDAVVDENDNIILAVLYSTFAKAEKDSDVMFVTSVGSTTDSEGSSAVAITGVVKEETVKIVVTSDTYIENRSGVKISTDFEDVFSKGDVIQYNGSDEVAAVRVIATAAQIANVDDTDILLNDTDEDNDVQGFIYSGQASEIRNGSITFTDGTEVDCSSSVPTMIVRLNSAESAISRVYTSRLSVDMAESDDSNYTDNDDYVIVYKFDGDAYAAIIVDFDDDTKF